MSADTECNSVLLTCMDAAQAAQLFEESVLRRDNALASVIPAEARDAPGDEMVELLRGYFDDDDDVEFAVSLAAEAYRAGRGAYR